jgi:hypothetical protein
MTESLRLEDFLPEIGSIREMFRAMEWAEEEIESARARHGETGRGPLWGSFKILTPTLDRMYSETLYRAHCRELLERVAAGQPVEPATDVEMILALMEASLTAPPNSSVICLYLRLAQRSLPEMFAVASDHTDLEAYESVHGGAASDHENWLRAKLSRRRGES